MKDIMNNRDTRQQINNRFFYTAIALWYLVCTINETVLIESLFTSVLVFTMRWVVRLLLIAKIMQQTYYRRDVLRIFIFSGTILISYYFCRYQELIWIFLFVLAAQNIEMQIVAKVTMLLTATTAITVIILASIGIISNDLVYSTNIYSGTYSKVRLYGFSHHNFLGCRILLFYLCQVYLRYDNFNVFDYGIGIATSVILYTLFRSRTSAVLLVSCILIIYTLKLLEHLEKRQGILLVRFGIYSIMVFSIVFSIVVTLGYNRGNIICIAINSLIYKRFSYASKVLREYGISFLGQQVDLVSSITAGELGLDAVIIDNAFMLMIIRCGLLFFFLIIYSYFFITSKSIQAKNYKIAAIIGLYFMCGISEKWLFTISYNPFVLLLSVVLFNKNDYLIMGKEKLFTNQHQVEFRVSRLRK
jgi:hypothetical protein